MPTWPKIVARVIGTLDAILSLSGLCLLLDPISHGVFAVHANVVGAPYFRLAFVAMIITNGVFLVLFVLAAVQLLRLKKSGVMAHGTASALLVAYDLLIALFWSGRGPVGMSVAAATGVGNLGIAPFQCFNFAPYVYPMASTVLLLIAHRKMAGTLQQGVAR
jgi:hypothetical protein